MKKGNYKRRPLSIPRIPKEQFLKMTEPKKEYELIIRFLSDTPFYEIRSYMINSLLNEFQNLTMWDLKRVQESLIEKQKNRIAELEAQIEKIQETQVENYEKAKVDNFAGWVRHHRLETHNSDGDRRLVDLTVDELKALDMYYDRPPEELIWLRSSEHTKLHCKGKK